MADVSEVSAVQPKENPRERSDWWRQWIRGTKKAADQHWKDAKEAWAEYEDGKPSNLSETQNLRCHPIYWSTCKTIESAYYTHPPELTSSRRFGVSDGTALTASIIKERLGTYLLDKCNIDDVMLKAVQDLIHAGKTTTQVIYAVETNEPELGPDGLPPVDEMGNPLQPEITKQEIYPAAILYDEILHTPDAKCDREITDMAYHFSMSEDEARDRFGDKANDIKWLTSRSLGGDERDNEKKGQEIPGKFVEGWECWSKVTKRVYWVSEQYSSDFLDSKDDPYRLKNFFPSPPFIFDSRPSKHLYPTPWFIQLKSISEQLHELTRKQFRLIKAIRRRAIVDGADENLIIALNDLTDNEYVAAKGARALIEKGGLENMIWFIPVQELVASLGELDTLEEKFKNKFYEWSGVPDILRGNTDPQEPLGSQQIKQTHAYGRFEVQVAQIARLARDTISMMIDLALGTFADDKIMRCIGFNYMEPEHQQRFPEALALLRNDEEDTVRIEVSADSISFLKKTLKQQQKNALAQTVNQGLQSIAQAAKSSPVIASIMLDMLLVSLEQLEGGKDIMENVKAQVTQLIEQMSTPPEPGPDYESMKLELAGRKVDIDGMKGQVENYAKQREVERKDFEVQIKASESQVANQVSMIQGQLAQVESQMAARIQGFTEYIGQQQLELERYKVTLDEREKFIEEQRLAMDSQIENVKLQMTPPETQVPAEPQPPMIVQVPMPQMPPINITVGKGSSRIVRDPLTGDILGTTEEDPTPTVPILPLGVGL